VSIFYIFFLRLISFLEGSDKVILTIVFFLAIVAHILYLNDWKISLKKKETIPLGVFLYFVFHTLIFSIPTIQFFGIIFSYYLWYLFTKLKFEEKSKIQAVRFLVTSLVIYITINFIWYYIEYSHLRTGINTTLGYFDIVAYRVRFPMEQSQTGNSIVVGLTSLLTMYLIKHTSNSLHRAFLYLLYFWSIYVLVVLDSRSPLIISLFFGLCMGLGLRTLIRFVNQYWLPLVLVTLILVNIFYNTDIFQDFKRPGELEQEVIARPKIWLLALSYTFQDLGFLFGHGLNSFTEIISQESTSLSTTHNIFLQILFDFGLAGIVFFGYFVQRTIRILYQYGDLNLMLIFTSFFLYGCLESTPSYYTFTPTLIFIPFLIIVYKLRNENI
jgi:hypothetical protein